MNPRSPHVASLAGGSLLLFAALWGGAAVVRPQLGLKPSQELRLQIPEQSGRITGRVLRADGQPLARAFVTLTPNGRPTEGITVRADSQGTFEFVDVVPGRYQLSATKTGFVGQVFGQRGSGPGRTLTVASGQTLERLDFRLERAGVISGSVSDEDFEPVEGLPVRAQRLRFFPGGRHEATTVRAARTDDLGNYRLAGLGPGLYIVQAGSREGVSISTATRLNFAGTYYPGVASREEARRVVVTSGSETPRIDFSVRVTPTFSINGVIVDGRTSNSPRRYAVGLSSGIGVALVNVDRSDGTFTLRGLEPGDYTVVGQVSDETGQKQGYRKVVITNSDIRVVIEIGRSAEIRGEVFAEGEGKFSFDGLIVQLQGETEGSVSPSGKTEENGHFFIREVPEGQYSVEINGREHEIYLNGVHCNGEDHATRRVTLSADRPVECRLAVARDVGQVRGVVTHEEKPVEGMVVVLIPVERERRRIARRTSVAQTDANGAYEIRGVIPGEYFAFAVVPSYDAIYYGLEFADRNQESAVRVKVIPKEPQLVNLTVVQPR